MIYDIFFASEDLEYQVKEGEKRVILTGEEKKEKYDCWLVVREKHSTWAERRKDAWRL